MSDLARARRPYEGHPPANTDINYLLVTLRDCDQITSTLSPWSTGQRVPRQRLPRRGLRLQGPKKEAEAHGPGLS